MKSGTLFSSTVALLSVVSVAVATTTLFADRTSANDKLAAESSLSKPIVDRFDTNGNGKIDPEEVAAARAADGKRQGKNGRAQTGEVREALLKKFDTNGNGKLDPNECANAKAAIEKRRAASGPGDRIGKSKLNRGGKGKSAPGLDDAKRQALLKKFDANANGTLDPDEIQAARAARQARIANKKVGKK